MGIIVGLDVGGSTTKIVGLLDGQIISRDMVRATDPVASAFGALGKFLDVNHLQISEIDCLKITGVGASLPSGDLLGIPTKPVQEFLATGLGGLFLSALPQAIVVSMGTGTAFVNASSQTVRHIIGSGIGGGTVLGLANRILNIRDFDLLADMAEHGHLQPVDLSIGDISRIEIPGLSMETTASNFGKMSDNASREDLAIGIFNLVFQSIGTMAVLAARNAGLKDVVFTGRMTHLRQCHQLLSAFSELYNVRFHVPEMSEFATAIGAAICSEDE